MPVQFNRYVNGHHNRVLIRSPCGLTHNLLILINQLKNVHKLTGRSRRIERAGKNGNAAARIKNVARTNT